MTTYPLSEAATIYSYAGDRKVIGRGTLAECAERLASDLADQKDQAQIKMDDLDLAFGPGEVAKLLTFLRTENAGLSNKEIAEIKDADNDVP